MAGVIVHDMPFADYLAVKAASASALKRLRTSPLHCIAGDEPGKAPQPSRRRGSLLHTLALEPEAMAARYAIKPDGMNFSTKDGKAWRETQESAGLVIVTTEEHKASERQAAALRALPEVGALLGAGRAEVSFFWTDPDTGIDCKARADWVWPGHDGSILLDLKTAQDVSRRGFGRICARLGYGIQAAWYSRGWKLAGGGDVLGFVFGAVESSWPHDAAPFTLTPVSLARSEEDCRRLLRKYADCIKTDQWPGQARGIVELDLPEWAHMEDEE